MRVSKKLIEKRQKSYENITSEESVLLRVNRSIQVEGGHGVIKYDYNFNRFLTRGKPRMGQRNLCVCVWGITSTKVPLLLQKVVLRHLLFVFGVKRLNSLSVSC